MRPHLLALTLAAVSLAACNDDPGSPQNPETIQLSAAQAAAIRTRIGQIAPVHPELSWLADTIALVVGTGLEVHQVYINTNIGTGPLGLPKLYYAVSLQRTIRTGASNAAAFDVILFNDASNPTDFIIATGWTNPNSDTDPPTTVSGTFGQPTENSIVNAHIFHVSGSTVEAWRAEAGTATFSFGNSSGTCQSVTNTSTVTCQAAVLNATFNVTSARSDDETVSSMRTASLPATDVSGIIIRMTFE